MTDKKLREVLQKLTDACVVAGNLIPWSVYSAAREALAEPTAVEPHGTHPEYLRGLREATSAIDTAYGKSPEGESKALLACRISEMIRALAETKPVPLCDRCHKPLDNHGLCRGEDRPHVSAPTPHDPEQCNIEPCPQGVLLLTKAAMELSELHALLFDTLRCLEPISRNGRLSDGEQRGSRANVEDCMRKIRVAIKVGW